MATTIREQVLAAFEALLAGISGYKQTLRLPARGFDALTDFPSILIEDGQATATVETEIHYLITQTVSVTVVLRDSTAIGTAASAAFGDIFAAVAAWQSDPVLGVLCDRVIWESCSEVDVESSDGTAPIGAIDIVHTIEYRQRIDDPFSQ